MRKIAIFASGTGSNFQAIKEAVDKGIINAELSVLVSDRPKSLSIEKAERFDVPCFAFYPKKYSSKEEYELVILNELKRMEVDLIVLAGYMRLIGPTLLKEYNRRIINIHPSLLPSFKGKDAVGQAMEAGVDITGVTVHYVDSGMDTGEIISQQELDISNLKTRDEIETEIHKIEHKLYPSTINKVLEGLEWEER